MATESEILGNIKSLTTRLDAAGIALDDAKKYRDAHIALRDEYYRQVHYHLDRGDQTNANIMEPKYMTEAGIVTIAINQVTSKQGDYDAILKQLAEQTANLSPTQQAVVNNTIEVNKLKAETEKTNSEANKATADGQTFAQSQSRIITYVGVGVGVVLVFVFIYFNFFNKKRPLAE